MWGPGAPRAPCDKVIRLLLDLREGRRRKFRRTLQGHNYPVTSVALSPDSTTIATGSLENTAKLWDAHTGEHIHSLLGHGTTVNSVSFSPDGTTIATASDDQTAKLWQLYPARFGRFSLEELVAHATKPISHEELVERAPQPTLLEAIARFFARLLPSEENEIDGEDDA